MEPDKCEEWVWYSFEEIKQLKPEQLFLPVQNLLKQLPELRIVLSETYTSHFQPNGLLN